jgi:hypothetical protein
VSQILRYKTGSAVPFILTTDIIIILVVLQSAFTAINLLGIYLWAAL